MNPTPTLKSVTKDFTTWRTTRGHHRRTPLDLQTKALALKNNYPISKIVIALGINSDALKRWSCSGTRAKKPSFSNAAFISLPMEEPISSHSESNAMAYCEFPNGLKLTLLSSAFSLSLLQQLYALQPEVAR